MRKMKLGLEDLLSRGKRGAEATKLMNVKVPTVLLARISALAATLRAKKTDVVVAILNEGLDTAETLTRRTDAPDRQGEVLGPQPEIVRSRAGLQERVRDGVVAV